MMFYVTGFDELFEPRRCQVSWFTTQSVCDRRGLDAVTSCGERRSFIVPLVPSISRLLHNHQNYR